MMLGLSGLRVCSSIVFCLKSAGRLHPCAVANDTNSSITSETSCLTPVFSSSAECEDVSKITLAGWKAMGLYCQRVAPWQIGFNNLPYHPLELLLSDVRRHLAFDATGTQSYSQSLSHIVLYGCRDFATPISWSNKDLRRTAVLKLACP